MIICVVLLGLGGNCGLAMTVKEASVPEIFFIPLPRIILQRNLHTLTAHALIQGGNSLLET